MTFGAGPGLDSHDDGPPALCPDRRAWSYRDAAAAGGVEGVVHEGAAISPVGRWSLIVMAGALLWWSVTFASLPIYYAAALSAAFVLLS